MQVKYTGDVPILFMHEGHVWDVAPGDEIPVDTKPDHPQFIEVKPAKVKGD